MAGLAAHLASLPTRSYAAGEVVLATGSMTGQLLFLKEGAVEVVKEGVRITRVAEPGAVFGEMSALLDQPHSADVRSLAPSTFHVVDDAKAFLQTEPGAALWVAVVLAQRLDALNRYLVDARHQFRDLDGHVGMIDEVIDAIVNKHPRRVERRGPGSV
jgi:CRP/FNR family transcriptional regulator, cyclic AMP receptor protein